MKIIEMNGGHYWIQKVDEGYYASVIDYANISRSNSPDFKRKRDAVKWAKDYFKEVA